AWTEPVTHEEIAAEPLEGIDETGLTEEAIPAEPLEGVHEPGFTEEGADLSIDPFEAAPQASQASQDSMVRAVAERFGVVLRDAVGSKLPVPIVRPTAANRLVNEIEETPQAIETETSLTLEPITLDSSMPIGFDRETETVEPAAEMPEEPLEEELVEIQTVEA